MNSSDSPKIEYEIKPGGKFSLNFSELWQYRELFYFFTWRDIKVKYKQSFLGILWAILQPGLMMVIFTCFFGRLLKVPSDDLDYPVFVFSGLIFWNVFSSGLAHSADSMVANSNIIKKIYFPRLIIPTSSILVALFDFSITIVLFIGLLVFYQVNVNLLKFTLYFPAALLITIITTFGLGTLLAALNVKYRDFRYALPFFIQILLFSTPVIYPVSVSKDSWAEPLLALNPLSAAISLIRASLTDTPLDLPVILTGCISAVVLLIAGLLVFRKTEEYFADLV